MCLLWLCPELVVYNSSVHFSGEVATTTWYCYCHMVLGLELQYDCPSPGHIDMYTNFSRRSDWGRSVSVFLVLPLWVATRLNSPKAYSFTCWSLKLWYYLYWQPKMRTVVAKWKDTEVTWGKWDGWTHGSKMNWFHWHFIFKNNVIDLKTELTL